MGVGRAAICICVRCQVISWNVDGLRGKLRLDGLVKIVNAEQPDLLVIQETKMQVLLARGPLQHINCHNG